MPTRWATCSALAPPLLYLPLSSKFYSHMVHNTYVMKWALRFHMEVFSLWYTPCSLTFLLADFHACGCRCLSFFYASQLSWFARFRVLSNSIIPKSYLNFLLLKMYLILNYLYLFLLCMYIQTQLLLNNIWTFSY